MPQIRKLLIANRGEIAIRIIHAARSLGISTVAVYSEADAECAHAHLADEAVLIGAPEPSASYLNIGRIIEAARAVGADAIHPGYGFLSERAEFADACEAAGIIFVGPPASAMRALGSKIDAKKLAVASGVPVTPGFFELGASVAQLKQAAEKIGFPVLLKASAGGGGRGMRAVHDPSEFDHACEQASSEALNAFGDGAMMVEKLVERPRHIEVQVIADSQGNVAVLFERECSLQRRHQKLIEEAPAPALARQSDGGAAAWAKLCGYATELVRAAGYRNAGTLEFLFDEASGKFYFMEVNARLQVEHPVTEEITGVDLVRQQLRVASGLPLEFSQPERTAIHGHAIEARIVAEDPAMGFLPSTGKIVGWHEPKMPGLRIDTGFGEGSEVSRYYDSLIAKVIVHGEDRGDAISKMTEALRNFHILGVKTNISYLIDVISHPAFAAGDFDTGFLGREFGDWAPSSEIPDELGAILSFAPASSEAATVDSSGAWDAGDSFRIAR